MFLFWLFGCCVSFVIGAIAEGSGIAQEAEAKDAMIERLERELRLANNRLDRRSA
jgi:hypothetical protein